MRVLVGMILIFGNVLLATEHDVLLTVGAGVVPDSVLTDLEIVSSVQVGSGNSYQMSITSASSESDLYASMMSYDGIVSVEENQQTTLETLEPASELDSRIIFVIDNIEDEATYLISEAELDSRIIFVIDGSGADYAPLYRQYHVSEVNAHLAWELSNGIGLTVAVLDTGVDLDHPFLAGNLLPGYDFVDDDAVPDDYRGDLDSNGNGLLDEGWGHGTHVAGIIKTIAPGASILPVRVINSDGTGNLSNLVEGVYYAIDAGVDVINLSMSVSKASHALTAALAQATAAGILVVTSAGNSDNKRVVFPSDEPGVITVAALDATRTKATFSNYGHDIDVSAPGVGIISTHPGGTYVGRSGTSMSAPIVSALAAMVWQVDPTQSTSQVTTSLTESAQDIGAWNVKAKDLGSGLVDVFGALNYQP